MSDVYKWREAEDEIRAAWDDYRLFLLLGPRQAGKTTLMKHLQKIYGGVYYTLDHPQVLEAFEHTPEDLITDDVVFLDEIQNSQNPGPILRLLHDEYSSTRLVVSGSGIFERRLHLQGYLVGRAKVIYVLPLSFREFVRWHAKIPGGYERRRKEFWGFLKTGAVPSLEAGPQFLRKYFEDYMHIGGYPQVVLEKDMNRLAEIVNATLEKDIGGLLSADERVRLKTFVRHIAALSGNLLKPSSLPFPGRLVQKYLDALEDAAIIKVIRPFFNNPLKELRKTPKVYFYDLGFRRILMPVETGFHVEHFVFRQLLPEHYWMSKDKSEVDFVLMERDGPIPVEVKTMATSGKSLNRFIKQYEPFRAILLSLHEKPAVSKIGSTVLLKWPLFLI